MCILQAGKLRRYKIDEPDGKNCEDDPTEGFSPSAQYSQLFFPALALGYLASCLDYACFDPWPTSSVARHIAFGDHISTDLNHNAIRSRLSDFPT